MIGMAHFRFAETKHSSGTKFWRGMTINLGGASVTIRQWGKVNAMQGGGQFKVEKGDKLEKLFEEKLSKGYKETPRSELGACVTAKQLEAQVVQAFQIPRLFSKAKELFSQIAEALEILEPNFSSVGPQNQSKPKSHEDRAPVDRGEA